MNNIIIIKEQNNKEKKEEIMKIINVILNNINKKMSIRKKIYW